jgi:RND family efflux transporter MFP subunit
MAEHELVRLLHQIRKKAGAGGLSDAQLLERFVATGDEAAFELLVWRHERLVFGLCRRVLNDCHDAEDAFQATFLALARKARSIGRREALSSWLYRVAYRTALTARARNARRAAYQTALAAALCVAAPPDMSMTPERAELRAVLDEELNRLPERFRAPTVLCYLEGKTVDEAAGQLGCPRGTVASRLARARERLRVRLTKRGLTLPAGAAAAALSWAAASSAAPRSLVTKTATFAGRAGAQTAGAAIPAKVVSLTQEVLRAMSMQKLTTTAAAVIASVGILLVAGGLGMQLHGSALPDAVPMVAREAPPGKGPGGEKPPLAQDGPGTRKPAPKKGRPETPRPKVVKPLQRELAPFEDFAGRLEAVRTVEVRAQVGGRVQEVAVKNGQDVTKGQLLFEFDSTQARANLARAEAALDVAEARRKLSATDLERVRRLVANNAVTREEFDKATAAAAVDAAAHKIAKLDMERARRDLDATRIWAPVDGRVGRLQVTPGNQVAGGDGQLTLLATITALDPIHVAFDMDERSFLRYQRLLREGQVKGVGSPLSMSLADEEGFSHQGKLVSFDDQFNSKTGTIRVHGVFRNTDRQLLPGMFARVRMPFGKPRRMLEVPESAFLTNKGKPIVIEGQYLVRVLNDKNDVEGRLVTVGQRDGNMRVITAGLAPEDTVFSQGLAVSSEELPLLERELFDKK